MKKPRIGIFGLTGCAGDQLVILNCEDELLDLMGALDVRDFLMASSTNDAQCELDIALVEGAVLSARDEERLRQIRARCRMLVAIGTCAVWGGIAAMNGDEKRHALVTEIYGPEGNVFDTQPARALHEVVSVDGNISGCPIERDQFLSAIANLLNDDAPLLTENSVCHECKMRENNCLLVERGEICLGPITNGGCDARCPTLGVACVGCRGPVYDGNLPSLMASFEEKGFTREQVVRKLRTFAPLSEIALSSGGQSS